jgi:hypothetical protein
VPKIKKLIYVCAPLTELPKKIQKSIKDFYTRVGHIAGGVTGIAGFVPHEHCDPIKHAKLTPKQVDKIERKRVAKFTSCLVVFPFAPSWGGGIEVEIARANKVPILVFAHVKKRLSRLLLGNPGIKKGMVIRYKNRKDAGRLVFEKFLELKREKKI